MLAILAFLSFSAFAATENNFTYQAQVIAGQADCATEATSWAHKFAVATGAQVTTATCRSEQTLNAENKTYKVYNLGLIYKAPYALAPYSILIGKRDSSSSATRLNLEPLFPTMDSCLADVATQAAYFENETGLKTATATCIADSPYSAETQYFLKIEGFSKNNHFGSSQPKKNIYTFAPNAFEGLQTSRQVELADFIAGYGATIVKQGPGLFVYYRAGGALPLNAEDASFNRNEAECEAQRAAAQAIYLKAGSKQVVTWCQDSRLEVIHDGFYYLNQQPFANTTQYGSFESCVADKDFALSDSRNSTALGALCGPSNYDGHSYTMTLFRKGF